MGNLKKEQAKIHKEFGYLGKVQNVGLEFVLAQAKEICGYFNRLTLAPFPAWEYFLLSIIERDEEDFLYRFYLIRNEFGVLEPDMQRINQII